MGCQEARNKMLLREINTNRKKFKVVIMNFSFVLREIFLKDLVTRLMFHFQLIAWTLLIFAVIRAISKMSNAKLQFRIS